MFKWSLSESIPVPHFVWKDIDFWTMNAHFNVLYILWYCLPFRSFGLRLPLGHCHDTTERQQVALKGMAVWGHDKLLSPWFGRERPNQWMVGWWILLWDTGTPWAHFWGLMQILAKKHRVFLGWITNFNWLSIDHWNCLVWHVFGVLGTG